MSNLVLTDEQRARAERALTKAAAFGEDLDMGRYQAGRFDRDIIGDLTMLTPEQQKRLIKAGVDPRAKERAGTYVQVDHTAVHRRSNLGDVEIMGIDEALTQYPDLLDRWWKLVAVDADKYTAQVALTPPRGYFIHAKPGARSIYPLQACLFIGESGKVQNVHNIILAEPDSELHIISGCAVDVDVKDAAHVGVSEIYVSRGAKVTFTMIHNWAEEMAVRPRTGIVVEEGGLFVSNYVCLQPVRTLQMYPTARLVGPGAVARFNSVLVGTPGSFLDVGSRVLLEAPRTRAEIISRTVSTGGEIIARGHLAGRAPQVKAHLECQGLMLTEHGRIYAIPELETIEADVEMSHEAAVGKIAQEEIEYLMARGLTADEATSTIVRGFLNVDIEGLPYELQEDLDRVIKASEESLF
ncbi:MAG: SufD family Fe-S cluster assembly protein [Chloroflexi bacterium]|nr:SufD family Fe-S cluster assembly protein [Chloroflexota bacterium]MBU1749055.1 SufD family Fe-S cluster assembly protein [Chloroflexota bacterium]